MRLPIKEKVRVVFAVLAGEITVAEAARRHAVRSQAIYQWRDKFHDAG